MGMFSKAQSEKLNPWFCIACDLKAGTTKLPLELSADPYRKIRLSDMMILDSKDSGRLLVRAESARQAKEIAQVHLKAYMATRSKMRKNRVAA